jgi:WD40 repeat protein
MRARGWLLAACLLPGADVRAGDARPVRLEHAGAAFAVVFAPDGKTLFTGSDDSTVRTWDVQTGKELRRSAGHPGGVLALALTADGRTLASGGRDQTVRLWDVRSGKELRRLAAPPGDVEGLALSGDGTLLVASTAGRGGVFRTPQDGLVLG